MKKSHVNSSTSVVVFAVGSYITINIMRYRTKKKLMLIVVAELNGKYIMNDDTISGPYQSAWDTWKEEKI